MTTDFTADGLYFLPLGGAEEFGINFNLYCCDGEWIAFDCGMGFADHRFPNVDILLPDPEFIEQRREKLTGLVITHAHEDHIGAVAHLWPRLQCPIFCTPFTAAVLREKFHDFPDCKRAEIVEIKPGRRTTLGPFVLDFHHVTHSIPQAVATVIETRYGRVFHSGDWNLDPQPVLDQPIAESRFRQIGDEGILAYIGDSTNAPIAGRSGSESEVEKGLGAVFKNAEGRIAITIFASNIGRIKSIAKAAKASGRSVCVLGRSLHRMTGCARANGYLTDIERFVTEDDLSYIPKDNVVVIATGSQGEPMAALARISRGEWPGIKLDREDTVIFSSRAIPGNETEINAVKNNLTAAGVKILDPDNAGHKIHVSGHPYADEVRDMLSWLRPSIVVPVHGERLMLEAQAAIARDLNIPHTVVPQNGSVIRLAPGDPQIVDRIKTGTLAVEPQRIVKSGHKGITERRKLQFSGAIHISVALDGRYALLMPPQITVIGLIDDSPNEKAVIDDIRDEVQAVIDDIRDETHIDLRKIEEEIRISVRRMISQILGIKPKVSVHIMKA